MQPPLSNRRPHKVGHLAHSRNLTIVVIAGLIVSTATPSQVVAQKVKLQEVYAYRTDSFPLAYWALPVPDKPWLVVGSVANNNPDCRRCIDLVVTDWERQLTLASRTTGPTEDTPIGDCQHQSVFFGSPIAVIRELLVVSICSNIQILHLPDLKSDQVSLDIGPDERVLEIGALPQRELIVALVGVLDARGRPRRERVLLYDTSTWQIELEIPLGNGGGFPPRLSLSPDGRFLAAATQVVDRGFGIGDQVRVIDLTDGGLLSQFHLKPLPDEDGYHQPPYFFAGKESQWLLSSRGSKTSKKHTMYVWDWRLGKVARIIRDQSGIGALLDVSHDGTWVAASVRDDPDRALFGRTQDFKIWDVETGKTVYESPKYFWRSRFPMRDVTLEPQLKLTFSSDKTLLVEASGYDVVSVYGIGQ